VLHRLPALAVCAALGALVSAAPAAAQQVWPIPQPEEEKKEQPAPEPEAPAQPAPTAPSGGATDPNAAPPPEDDPFANIGADVLSSYAVRQGQIGIGAGIVPSLNITGTFQALAGTTGNTNPLGGSGTYVLALSPQFSYFPISRLEVGGFVGPVLRHRLRAGSSIPWPELAGTVGAFAAFHYPVTDGLLLIGTAGGSPLIGASGAPDTSATGSGIDLSVLGGIYGFVRGGAGYMFNRHFQARVEGEASIIGDIEYATGTGALSLSAMTNTGVRLSVHGYF
jgi:hypothetical protein